MSQHSENHLWDMWPGWSTISAHNELSFTVWLTGLPGTGKTTLAQLVKKSLASRGYKVEIIDPQTLSHWLNLKLQISADIREDRGQRLGYDAIITYICALLARNGIITITSSISPNMEARKYAREQIGQFIEVYLYCTREQRLQRLAQLKSTLPIIAEEDYQPPLHAELSIDTTQELAERSALRLIDYLEQHGYIAPLWEDAGDDDEVSMIKARLQALGYLE